MVSKLDTILNKLWNETLSNAHMWAVSVVATTLELLLHAPKPEDYSKRIPSQLTFLVALKDKKIYLMRSSHFASKASGPALGTEVKLKGRKTPDIRTRALQVNLSI
jgi:hypothetical protein